MLDLREEEPFLDGVVELELAVERVRAFHGVVWRVQDEENYESFFVRPHQAGNPDAIQYTPVFNGISSWQLYHGDGFWAPIEFPIGERFTIRVAFAGLRAEVFVGDLDEPALAIRELKRAPVAGGVGVIAGGPGLNVLRFAYDKGDVAFRAPLPPPATRVDDIVPAWWVSDPFPEDDPPPLREPDVDATRERADRPRRPRARDRHPRREEHGSTRARRSPRPARRRRSLRSASATARSYP